MEAHRIWILIDSSGIGGIETHVTGLVTALRKQAFNAMIVLLDHHGNHPLQSAWDTAGVPVKIIEGGMIGLRNALAKERPALVHTHGYKAGILGKALCRTLRIPVVSTYHAGEPGTGRVKLYNAVDNAFGILGQSIAVSGPIAARLGKASQTIPNFVEIPDAMALGGDTIAFVGRLSHEKGPDRFLEISAKFPGSPFDVYGDGPERVEMERLATDNVCFWGAVPSMSSYWRGIGLLCIPSRHEGLPLVALEAMACGVPVVAFGVGALPDLIDHGRNGFVVPSGDMEAMAKSITSWQQMSLGQKTEMSLRARNHIQDTYSTRVILPRILDVYDRALKAHAGKAGLPSSIRDASAVA